MNHILFCFLITNLMILALFQLSKYYSFFLDEVNDEVRQIHSKKMIKFGGIIYLISTYLLFIINNNILTNCIIFANLFLLIGLFADINKKFNANARLIISIFLVIIFLILNPLTISSIEYQLIDYLFENIPLFTFIFTVLAILFCINGSNLIDGQHGLMLGSTIIIFSNLIIFIPNETELFQTIFFLIIATSILFIYNFFSGSIKIGDTGSYFLGFIIASLALYINYSDIISPFHIACIIFYPSFEAIFSYLRRVINRKNPFMPDAMHLHSMIFKILNSKYKKLHKEMNNRLTTIIILSFQIISWILIYLLDDYFSYSKIFFTACITYVVIYLFVLVKLNRLLKSS